MAVLKTTDSDGALKIRQTQRQDLDGLLDRARALGNPAQEPANWTAALKLFAAELSRQEVVLRNNYANASAEAINDLDSASQTVYQRFSETPRWARVESILLDPLTGLLRALSLRHSVEIRLLGGGKESALLWHSENPAKEPIHLPETFEAAPTNTATDLASALKSFVLEKRGNQRTAVVLFSDGQHNDGPSPLDAARALGNAGMPLYAVGLGTASDPLNAVTDRSLAAQSNERSKSKELLDIGCNEPLLREMASLSGGMYLREEQAGRLLRLLETVSEGRVVESETVLWQSWWWFGTVIFLFALEWALRKRAGLL